MRMWIQRERRGPSADRPSLDWAELGARVREAAVLATALHLGETAQQVAAGETDMLVPDYQREDYQCEDHRREGSW